MTDRIHPGDLTALYQQANVIPEQGGYHDERAIAGTGEQTQDYACGLGIAYYAATGYRFFPTNDSASVSDMLGISHSYLQGYLEGFDQEMLDRTRNHDLEYLQGYQDGCFGWHSVKHLVPAAIDEE